MNSIRKENDETNTGPDEKVETDSDQLPVRRNQATSLIGAPRQGLKVVVERSADAYFSSCRRIAEFLNRRK